jgi:hypothetical protein
MPATMHTAVFPREEDWPGLDVITPRLLFCLVQAGQLIFGMYKLNGMGLLPVYPSDWISAIKVRGITCCKLGEWVPDFLWDRDACRH